MQISPPHSDDPFPEIVRRVKALHSIRVRKWRRTMTGCAWRVDHADGQSVKWIESPLPRSPISLAIFLHEVGHHVIGFDTHRRRCEEEFHAWQWALQSMATLGIPPDDRTLERVELSLRYAVDKAVRRGLKTLSEDLRAYAAAA